MEGSTFLTTLTTILGWIWQNLVNEVQALLSSETFVYLFLFGVGISFTMVVFKILRRLMWGA